MPELPQSSLPGDLALPLNLYLVRHFRLNASTLLSLITSISSVTLFALLGSHISYFDFCRYLTTNIPHIYETRFDNPKALGSRPKLYGKHRIFFSSPLQPPDRLWGTPNKYRGALSSRVKRLGFEGQQQPLFCSAVKFTSVNAVIERQANKHRASSSDRFLCISKTVFYNSQDESCVLQQCKKEVCQIIKIFIISREILLEVQLGVSKKNSVNIFWKVWSCLTIPTWTKQWPDTDDYSCVRGWGIRVSRRLDTTVLRLGLKKRKAISPSP